MEILNVSNLKKTYTTRLGGNHVHALKDVTFSVEQGEYVAIMGESGSGKTTLLNLLAALDKPTSGKIILDGNELSSVKERSLATFRRNNLGFVFQESFAPFMNASARMSELLFLLALVLMIKTFFAMISAS